MMKKTLAVLLLVCIYGIGSQSCKKEAKSTADETRNYFPLVYGKSVTYAVDSTYYIESSCIKYVTRSQLKYTITDTFTDRSKFSNKLSYIMNVYSRPYEGAQWKPQRVIFLNPDNASLFYTQDGVRYIKLQFPLENEKTWKGNMFAPVNDSLYSYLNDWNYVVKDVHLSYNTGTLNFDNTVTVIENDESVNYPNVDSGVAAYRTYAKEVYAYNVGMVYKEWTHWTYRAHNSQCVNGYSVVMRAIDHN